MRPITRAVTKAQAKLARARLMTVKRREQIARARAVAGMSATQFRVPPASILRRVGPGEHQRQRARMAGMYVAKQLKLPETVIGEAFGCHRDTVIRTVAEADRLAKASDVFESQVTAILREFGLPPISIDRGQWPPKETLMMSDEELDRLAASVEIPAWMSDV